MPLADWIGYASAGDAQFLIEPITPILGSGSGKLNLPTGGNANWAPDPGGAYTHGLTLLRYETLLKLTYYAEVDTASVRLGITWMQSHDSLVGTGKSFYFFGILNTGNDFISTSLVLQKTTDGWANLADLSAPIPTTTSIAFSVVQSLRVDSVYDLTGLGGNWLRCYHRLVDFTNMSLIFNILDYTAPLATSANEGIGVYTGGSAVRVETIWDEVSLYPVTL